MGSPGHNDVSNCLGVTRGKEQPGEEHASIIGCGCTDDSFALSQAGARFQVKNTTPSSLELRSVPSRSIAEAETGRWCTGCCAAPKPALAFLTHLSCLQELVWDLTSHHWTRDCVLPPLLVPFPDWVLKSPHCAAVSLHQSRSLSGTQAASVGAHQRWRWQGQDRGDGDQSRVTAFPDCNLKIRGKEQVLQTSAKTEKGHFI